MTILCNVEFDGCDKEFIEMIMLRRGCLLWLLRSYTLLRLYVKVNIGWVEC